MSFGLDDTIAALASAPGPGGRGIVRLSGADTVNVLERCFAAEADPEWTTRRTPHRVSGWLRLVEIAASLPVALHFWPTTRSYTGQTMAELHTIGSPPLLEAVLATLFDLGVRPARAGEFTLRAFLAGRIDLVQAEAVIGVVDAHDHVELKLALEQLAGGVSSRIDAIQTELIDLLADLEAGLDFTDEDIEFVDRQTVSQRVAQAHEELRKLLADATDRMQSTGRRRVVIAGLPNAGKSTLFNALTGRSAALVSEFEGTTRDYLVGTCHVRGTAFDLVDTAGWDSTTGDLTRMTQQFRGEQVERADLLLWCSAADLLGSAAQVDDEEFRSLLNHGTPVIRVRTKADFGAPNLDDEESLAVSALTGQGLDEVRERLSEELAGSHTGERQMLGTTASRCRETLTGAMEAMRRAETAAICGDGDELIAVELRDAIDHLGHVLGTVYTDDLLDRIFSKFCIGK